jgi:hypothetical protein
MQASAIHVSSVPRRWSGWTSDIDGLQAAADHPRSDLSGRTELSTANFRQNEKAAMALLGSATGAASVSPTIRIQEPSAAPRARVSLTQGSMFLTPGASLHRDFYVRASSGRHPPPCEDWHEGC